MKRTHPANSLLCFDGLSTNGKHVNVFNAHTVRPERVEGWWEVHRTGALVATKESVSES
ncbi:protein of unknown function [Candidatus Methylomirabilis oxygeniifera]|uniref:Uncharacterized protein n=1 Tax=Methylomirabilis oxygeniifera TaxID=671143 RepID=D5MLL2_METO1|nr:protein of unknown function [Candidatus Methylomirabilis oxyfera]